MYKIVPEHMVLVLRSRLFTVIMLYTHSIKRMLMYKINGITRISWIVLLIVTIGCSPRNPNSTRESEPEQSQESEEKLDVVKQRVDDLLSNPDDTKVWLHDSKDIYMRRHKSFRMRQKPEEDEHYMAACKATECAANILAANKAGISELQDLVEQSAKVFLHLNDTLPTNTRLVYRSSLVNFIGLIQRLRAKADQYLSGPYSRSFVVKNNYLLCKKLLMEDGEHTYFMVQFDTIICKRIESMRQRFTSSSGSDAPHSPLAKSLLEEADQTWQSFFKDLGAYFSESEQQKLSAVLARVVLLCIEALKAYEEAQCKWINLQHMLFS